jgi:hypothetical protein
MGHERIGVLPANRRWREVVGKIARAADASPAAAAVARQTLVALQGRFRNVERDEGVRAAFAFLVQLSVSARAAAVRQQVTGAQAPREGAARLEELSAFQLAKALRDDIARHQGSAEYRELAHAASVDAITQWVTQEARQGALFADIEARPSLWLRAGDGGGFSELARRFFSSFTERYLNYFLDRTASATLPTLEARNAFRKALRDHIDTVSRHAFDTAKITQSFAAGWFNRHAPTGNISRREIAGFLHVAFAKIREELLRQTTSR